MKVGVLLFILHPSAFILCFQIRHHPRRDQQPFGKDLAFRRLPAPRRVGEDEDFVVGLLAGGDLGIKRRAANPEAAEGVPVHLRGLLQQGVLRPQLDLVAVGDGEFRQRERRGRVGGSRRHGDGLGRGGDFPGSVAGRFFRGLERRAFQPVDLRLDLGDERIEHRHLLGIAPLLALAEAEDVSPVRRPPAVEEEFVFADDGGAEGGGGFQIWLPAERFGRAVGPSRIAADTRVDAVVGDRPLFNLKSEI